MVRGETLLPMPVIPSGGLKASLPVAKDPASPYRGGRTLAWLEKPLVQPAGHRDTLDVRWPGLAEQGNVERGLVVRRGERRAGMEEFA